MIEVDWVVETPILIGMPSKDVQGREVDVPMRIGQVASLEMVEIRCGREVVIGQVS